MELTQTEKDLIDGLILFGVEKDEAIGILLFLRHEYLQSLLIDYMVENQDATPQDILTKVRELLKLPSPDTIVYDTKGNKYRVNESGRLEPII